MLVEDRVFLGGEASLVPLSLENLEEKVPSPDLVGDAGGCSLSFELVLVSAPSRLALVGECRGSGVSVPTVSFGNAMAVGWRSSPLRLPWCPWLLATGVFLGEVERRLTPSELLRLWRNDRRPPVGLFCSNCCRRSEKL